MFLLVAIVSIDGFAIPAAAQQSDKRKPNIIIFLADDFDYECVTANGGKSYKTPNLDQLAKQGMRLNAATSSPCARRRASSS